MNKNTRVSYQQFGQLVASKELVNLVLVDEEGNIEFTDVFFFQDTPEVKYAVKEVSNLDLELVELPTKGK